MVVWSDHRLLMQIAWKADGRSNSASNSSHDDMLTAWKENMLRIEIIIHNHTILHIDKLTLGMTIA